MSEHDWMVALYVSEEILNNRPITGLRLTPEQYDHVIQNLRQYVVTSPDSLEQGEFKQLMGGFYGYQGGCAHTQLTSEEAVKVLVEVYGGSFQEAVERLARKGIFLFR